MAGTTPVTFVWSFGSYFIGIHWHDWGLQLTDDFSNSSIATIYGERVISYIVVSRTKNCMTLTRLMATTNQEIRDLPNALERQVQTLATVVERLT